MGLLSRYANPAQFLRLADRVMPLLAVGAVAAFCCGLYYALFASPPDYQQGRRCALCMCMCRRRGSGWGFIQRWRLRRGWDWYRGTFLADVFCVAAAPVGAVLVALCLVTGSLWGKPTWGAWWVWDARLTSVLILFLLYIGYIALRQSFDDDERGGKAGAILLLVGAVNIPIVKFSVEWWHTLHQPASILRMGGSAIAPEMLRPLLIMGAAYGFYAAFLILLRMKTVLLARKIARMREEA